MNTVARALAICALGNLSAVSLAGDDALVEYEVRFVATWSAETHPADFPFFNPHFSPLVGGTHHEGVSFWTPGGIASPGIESMAESGNRAPLRAEIQSAISAGSAESEILGPGAGSPDEVSTSLAISASHPLVTLVTMIAPSPDWFVGVHALDLRNADGLWRDELVVPLDPYDSGTDSGATYVTPDVNTNPQEPIRNIESEFPFNGNGSLGQFVFTRITQTSCSLADLAAPLGELDVFDVFAFLDAFNAADASADLNGDGAHDIFDVFAYLALFNSGCAV